MPTNELQPWVESRVLSFLNQARAEDFDRIRDDPSDGPGRGISASVAQKILETRNQMPARRFRNLTQVLDISGVGQGTLQDLGYSLGIPADQYFVDLLRNEVLPENWSIVPYSLDFEGEEDFYEAAHNLSALTDEVSDEVERIVQSRTQDRLTAYLAGELLEKCPIEVADDPHQASLRLASWFYAFDADNWFGFQHIWETCERYLNYFPEWEYRLDTYFFTGFPNSGVLVDHISPRDLPVVVNFGEQRITIWTSGLAD
jgi:hypothetical protein